MRLIIEDYCPYRVRPIYFNGDYKDVGWCELRECLCDCTVEECLEWGD